MNFVSNILSLPLMKYYVSLEQRLFSIPHRNCTQCTAQFKTAKPRALNTFNGTGYLLGYFYHSHQQFPSIKLRINALLILLSMNIMAHTPGHFREGSFYYSLFFRIYAAKR